MPTGLVFLAPFLTWLFPAGLVRRAPVLLLFPALLLFSAFGFWIFSGKAGSGLSFLPFLPVGNRPVGLVFSTNPIPLTLACLALGMGFLAQVFSLSYLSDHPRQRLFHFLMSGFQLAMAGLFLADSLFTLFFFWEWVGLFSYLLVQFWFEKAEVLASGFRVMMINKLGDIFLLAFLGLLASFGFFYPLFSDMQFPPGSEVFFDSRAGWMVAIFLVMAAAVKSAQFPFSVWLKEAMAGPASVSALLHSATMVLSGVWVLLWVLPWLPETIRQVLLGLGALGMVLAYSEAMVSAHFKKTLAALTLGTLSTLFLALGLGMTKAVPYYILAHAFYKAPLFLLCGWLMKQAARDGFSGDETQYFPNLSGRLSWFSPTGLVVILCLLSMAGLPLTTGFLAHELLLPAPTEDPGHRIGWVLLQFSGMASGFVALRIGLGLWKSNPSGRLVRSVSFGYALPILLAGLGVIWPAFGWNPTSTKGWLSEFWSVEPQVFFPLAPAALLGIALSFFFHRLSARPFAIRDSGWQTLSQFWPLGILTGTGRGIRWVALSLTRFDTGVLDRGLHFGSGAVLVLGYFSAFWDRWVVDGLLSGLVEVTRSLGRFAWDHIRRYPQYAVWFAVTVLLLVLYFSYYF